MAQYLRDYSDENHSFPSVKVAFFVALFEDGLVLSVWIW